jgi:type IV pilus assembly protein PilQ
MQSMFGFSSTIGAAALSTVLVASVSQPAWAAATQIVGVEVKDTSEGIELVLKQARPGDRPQVFSVERGSSWVADIINSQLVLPEGGNFQSLNPAPGIASIQVVALDANSVRLIVTGEGGAPSGQLSDRNPQGLSFSFVAGSGAAASGGRSAASAPVAQSPAPSNRAQPEVLVPNPEITITGGQPTAIPRQNPAPPFLPRAVAPPLGDIAVSDLSPQATTIDLGTVERVPRLVLRDAPAREVLALLARAAGLNLAFVNGDGASAPEGQSPTGGDEGPAITLDIENEPVQDVFNYVLRLTNLNAVRQGRTILVGSELPSQVKADTIIMRTFRINQAEASAVAGFLSTQGAETQRLVEKTTTVEEGDCPGVLCVTRTETEVAIEPLSAVEGDAPLLLKGVAISTDDRLNTITLIGSPNQIDLASALIRQQDLRVRQVAVNVKIVDINLLNTQEANSSFSFGIGDSFVVSDGGTAAINFGSLVPASGLGQLVPNVLNNPLAGTGTFVDLSQTIGPVPNTGIDTVTTVTTPTGVIGPTRTQGTDLTFSGRTASLGSDPFSAGISAITPATDSQINTTITPATGTTPATATTAFSAGTPGNLALSLPELFQYPNRFLAQLRSEIISGNAKILTDPTLTVQEGNVASIDLTQEVFAGFDEQVVIDEGVSRTNRTIIKQPVGLTLELAVDRIDDNGFVTLAINPTIASIAGTFNVEGSNSPAVLTSSRTLQSGKVRLRDGQTLILAGVIQEQERESVTKWPLLGDIPIIGSLFRNTTSSKTRNEVVVVVTPQILDDSDRSNFGYSYTPGTEAQQLIDRRR